MDILNLTAWKAERKNQGFSCHIAKRKLFRVYHAIARVIKGLQIFFQNQWELGVLSTLHGS